MSTLTPSLNPEAILQDLWDNALGEFKSVLSPDQYRRLHTVRTADDVVAELLGRDAEYKNQFLPKLLARLDSSFQQLSFFAKSISIYV